MPKHDPRIGSTEELKALLEKVQSDIENGKGLDEILARPDVRALARSTADRSKKQNERPIGNPRGPYKVSRASTSRSLPPRGGRGCGPEPRAPTLKEVLRRPQ